MVLKFQLGLFDDSIRRYREGGDPSWDRLLFVKRQKPRNVEPRCCSRTALACCRSM